MSLVVEVKSASALPNLERFSKSDPMVVLIFQGVKNKTKVIDNNLDPVWNERFEWALSTAPSPSEIIQIDIFDHETLGKNKLMAKTEVSLRDIISKGHYSPTLTLKGKKGDTLKSTISLDITYTAPAGGGGGGGGGGGATGDEDEIDAGDTDTGGGGDEGGGVEGDTGGGDAITAIDPSTAGAGSAEAKRKAKNRQAARSKLADKPTDFQVRVHVIEARKLPGGGLNPVVKVACGQQIKGTSSRKGTNNPFFDEMLYFNFNERPKELFDKICEIKVLNAKVLLLESMIGSFKFDLGMVYDEPEHCFIHKWLLLTDADDPSGGAKGYLKFSINIMGPGDEPKPSPSTLSQESVDIEANLLRPSGVRLQSGSLYVRIYRGEDMPQMDAGYFEGVKKLLNVGTVQKELVDPYCIVNFAGHKGKTKTIMNEQDPEWNQQVNLAVRFPSMCERIRFQLKDYDKLNKDDFIGTCFLSLSEISAPGDNGFLPTFGPCFINVYGSPREFTDLPDKFDYLNKGKIEGVSYRGRVMVQLFMEIGKLPSHRIEDIKIADINKLTPFLRRRKYKLYAAFFSATMIKPADNPVEFEVSIGNYGNKLDENVPAQASTTPPSNPVYDGNAYYYLPWTSEKPCIVVDSQWENNVYRIESQNILLFIANEIQKGLDAVKVIMTHEKYSHDECRDILLKAIQEASDHIGHGLPELPPNGFTELDKLKRGARIEELGLIMGEINQLLRNPDETPKENITLQPVLDLAEEIHMRLINLAVEPQNSIPDVIIWMLSGNKRVACTRIPSNELMYSSIAKARGDKCGKILNIHLKPPAVEKEEDLEGTDPAGATLRVLIWLGLEQDQSEWARAAPGGEVAVFAETYENHAFFLGKWGTTALMRPNWSDAKGKIEQPKVAFEPPPDGWVWDGDWKIKPELSVAFEPDEGLNEWTEDVYEHQMRRPFSGWPADSSHSSWFTVQGDELIEEDGKSKKKLTKDDIKIPDGWSWSTEWQVDANRACDEEGWEYCVEPDMGAWNPFERNHHLTRRRRWVRVRTRVMDSEAMAKTKRQREQQAKEGWEYARFHNMSYHITDQSLDCARRRRWMRKMVAVNPGKPPIFYFKDESKKKKKKKKDEDDDDDEELAATQQAPRMFVSFTDPHKYHLRAYIYQARDLYASDKSGLSDPYCIVSFNRYSKTTRIVSENLCPTWDETLIYDGLRMFGHPRVLIDSPPPIVIEIYDKDTIGRDEFIGFVQCTPNVILDDSYPRARLAWYEVTRYGKYAGDILAAFELFLDESMELPFAPPTAAEGHFTVPSGIRPTLQRTRMEILCWGIRDMKRFRLLQVTSPLVELECGGNVIKTKHIPDTKKNPNFPEPVVSMDVLLPKEQIYAPPLNIRVYDKRAFGQLPMVGCQVIKTLEGFVIDPNPNSLVRQNSMRLAARIKTRAPAPDKPAAETETAILLEEEGDTLDTDPDNKKDVKFDWWSKYYASIKDEQRTQKEYLDEHQDFMTVYEGELEDKFDNFTDLAQTFFLYRGKGGRDPDDPEGQCVGKFKGSIKVYPLPDDGTPEPEKVLSNIPPSKPVKVIVRVYIIKGIDLQPQDPNGKSDPFIKISIGKKTIDDEKNYIANNLNPLFGRMYEIPATLPLDHTLLIKVMDYDKTSANDLIGETTIDLENRFLTQHRAICGIPATFSKRGPNRWRDSEFPKDILSWYCKSQRRPEPVWISNTEVMFNGITYTLSQFETIKPPHDDVGAEDQRLALHILRQQNLVPEHVEKRTLFNPMYPGISQGALHMWVDIFPKSNAAPPPVDITPRKPEKYVLRMVIYNTKEVVLEETSVATGEAMSDIYVKGWLRGQDESQKTDVHYRSMDGEGNFNYRFVFPFEYLPAEETMVITKKEHFYSLDKTEMHLPPRFTLQVWDNDLFSPDDFLGTIDFNLTNIPLGAKTAEECSLEQLPEPGREVPMENLFERKRSKGWWPFSSEEEGERTLSGKVEMEMEIITLEEEQLKPAGKARDEPNMNPVLEEPKRPETSFFWLTSPLKTFKHIVWKFYKWHIIFAIIAVIFILLLVVFIYSAPKFLAEFLLQKLLPF